MQVWAKWLAFHQTGNVLTDKELHSIKPTERVEMFFNDPSNFCVLAEKLTKRKMLRWNMHPTGDEEKVEIVKQGLEHILEKCPITGRFWQLFSLVCRLVLCFEEAQSWRLCVWYLKYHYFTGLRSFLIKVVYLNKGHNNFLYSKSPLYYHGTVSYF